MRRPVVVAVVAVVVLIAGGVGIALALQGSSLPKEAACTDTGDRLTKTRLLEKLTAPPHVLILGSSRARPAIPAVVEQLTGGTAFNAGVQSGQASDEYVFTRLLAQKFPSARPAYIIFVDVLVAADGVHPELADLPLAKPFLGSAMRKVRTACTPNGEYTAYGGIAYPPPSQAQREAQVASELPGVLANIPADAKVPRHIDPASTKWFQKLLTFINGEGVTPVIVMNPLYPKVLKARERYGFPELEAAKTYLAWLRKHYHFVFINAENIKTWGGKASDFSNIDHIDRTNMSRLLKYIVKHSHGVLTK